MSFYEIRSIMNSNRKHNRFSSIQWLLLALPLMSLLNRTVKENALSLISILFSMKLVKCKTMNMSIPGTFFCYLCRCLCAIACVPRKFNEGSECDDVGKAHESAVRLWRHQGSMRMFCLSNVEGEWELWHHKHWTLNSVALKTVIMIVTPGTLWNG